MPNVIIEALLIDPALILNAGYRTPVNIAIKGAAPFLTKLNPHKSITPGALTVGATQIDDDTDFPEKLEGIASTAAVTLPNGNGQTANATLDAAEECGEWQDLLLTATGMRGLLLFHGAGEGEDDAQPVDDDDARDSHLQHCIVHQPPDAEDDDIDPTQGCAFIRSGPKTLDVTSGRGLPKPEMHEPRFVFKHGSGNWPRLRFVTHHLMSGDRYTMMTTLVLYPSVYVELIYCDRNKIKGHSDFFCGILPGRRAEFQVLETLVEKKRPPSAPEPQDAEGYYHYVKPDDRSVLVDTYWENPTAMGLSTYMVGQAFHEDAAGSRKRLMSAVSAAVPERGRAAADKFLADHIDRAGLHIVLWIRNEVNGKEWNMTPNGYAQLVAAARAVGRELGQPVRIVCCGSRLAEPYVRGGTPSGGLLNMIEFWEETGFPKQFGRAAQIYFWHQLAVREDVHCVFLGMRSGALEQLAIVGLPTIFMEPKSQAKTERADRMRQWIGRLPYSRCIIDEYLCDAEGEPRVVDADDTSKNGTFSEDDLTSIKVMLYDALRRHRPPSIGPARVNSKELQKDRQRRRNNTGPIAYPNYRNHKQSPYYYVANQPAMSLYGAFAAAAGKLMVPTLPSDIETQVAAVINEAAENSILKYAEDEVTDDIDGIVDAALVGLAAPVARAAVQAFAVQNAVSYQDNFPQLMAHLTTHGAVAAFNAGTFQARQEIVKLKEALVDYYSRLIGYGVITGGAFATRLQDEVGFDAANLTRDKLANAPAAPTAAVRVPNFPALVTAFTLDNAPALLTTQAQFELAEQRDGGFGGMLGKARLDIPIAGFTAACDVTLAATMVRRTAIDTSVLDRTITGLTSKKRTTQTEYERIVRYEWIEGEDDIRAAVRSYETDNGDDSGDAARHVDQAHRGKLRDDEYWLACCFDQPITLHFEPIDQPPKVIGPRGSQAQSVHILVQEVDLTTVFRPLYRTV